MLKVGMDDEQVIKALAVADKLFGFKREHLSGKFTSWPIPLLRGIIFSYFHFNLDMKSFVTKRAFGINKTTSMVENANKLHPKRMEKEHYAESYAAFVKEMQKEET